MKIRRNSVSTRSGFTLTELAISLAVFTVLMLAMGSAVMISTRALNTTAAATAGSFAHSDAVTTFSSDLQLAQRLVSTSPGAISFLVPDRDNNGDRELISYTWSGTAGDPLFRKINSGANIKIADDVYDFDLSYEARTLDPPAISTDVGSQSVIIFHDDAPGGFMSEFAIVGANWSAQYIKPQFQGNVLSWSLDRIEIRARKDAIPGGSFVVEVREADQQRKPVATALESVTVQESDLPLTFAPDTWTNVNFSSLTDLDPKGEYCIVIGSALSSTGTAALIEWESDGSTMTPRTHWMTSSDGGVNWSSPPQQNKHDMRFYVYGTATTMTRTDINISYGGTP